MPTDHGCACTAPVRSEARRCPWMPSDDIDDAKVSAGIQPAGPLWVDAAHQLDLFGLGAPFQIAGVQSGFADPLQRGLPRRQVTVART